MLASALCVTPLIELGFCSDIRPQSSSEAGSCERSCRGQASFHFGVLLLTPAHVCSPGPMQDQLVEQVKAGNVTEDQFASFSGPRG